MLVRIDVELLHLMCVNVSSDLIISLFLFDSVRRMKSKVCSFFTPCLLLATVIYVHVCTYVNVSCIAREHNAVQNEFREIYGNADCDTYFILPLNCMHRCLLELSDLTGRSSYGLADGCRSTDSAPLTRKLTWDNPFVTSNQRHLFNAVETE